MRKVLLLTTLVGLLPVGLFAQQGDNNQQKTLVFTHVTVRVAKLPIWSCWMPTHSKTLTIPEESLLSWSAPDSQRYVKGKD
jgi:hypothetical protein